MGLKIISEHLNGLILFETASFADARGEFMEAWRKDEFVALGINEDFVQDNHSVSHKNVLRGMHFQWEKPMGKLLRVTSGAIKVVEIDIRENSDTFGQHFSTILSAENRQQLWVPAGFANGFLSLADNTSLQYKCTAHWNATGEGAILWNDEKVGINWGIQNPIISDKDKQAISLDEWKNSKNAKYFRL